MTLFEIIKDEIENSQYNSLDCISELIKLDAINEEDAILEIENDYEDSYKHSAIFIFDDIYTYSTDQEYYQYFNKVTNITDSNINDIFHNIYLPSDVFSELDDNIGDKYKLYQHIDIKERDEALLFANDKFYLMNSHAEATNLLLQDLNIDKRYHSHHRPDYSKINVNTLAIGHVCNNVCFIEKNDLKNINIKEFAKRIINQLPIDKVYLIENDTNVIRIASSRYR